jgi:hypothetical protein
MPTPTVEQEVKQQFARLFVANDAPLFKKMADYYFKHAAFVKTTDIGITQDLKLLARNCQKRLFIGIGAELLLKATYLKHNFSINKIQGTQVGAPAFPFTFQAISGFVQAADKTYMLNDLVEKLHVVLPSADLTRVLRGLRIAKVFRNKEGHVVLPSHTFAPSNYRDIETALVALYSGSFQETLEVRFSVEPNEAAIWRIR